jgi:hypothetical protein
MNIDQPKKDIEWMNCLDISTICLLIFFELHDVTCYTRECYKHSHCQCKHNSDPIIGSYWKSTLLCNDIEKGEKYIAYIGAHDLDSLINEKLETSHEACIMKGHLDVIL